jgi:translation initiation factor IF-2
VRKEELTEEQIQAKIKETLEQLTTGRKSKGAKIRRDKRAERREQDALSEMERAEQSKVVKVTEYVTVADLATMMSVSTIQIISACMQLGIMVTQNQRLDAETLTLVAEEFGYTVEFVTAEVQESLPDLSDQEENLLPRAPIVTVMGHVDHGKTSLLDYIRKTNVIAGEAGGITQHIGAYTVELNNGKHITFLDTPGHEAFTAMRARGAQVTDVAIIVVAADDAVMPQTKEAIAHAQAAGVPFVFAINKVDKPSANPEKIKEQLAGMNLLVEDWGGKIQNQELSAKTGKGIDELLEKVLLEAEILDLKANPDRNANGTVIEASLDKGRGYVSTILVQGGTLRIGDVVLAGTFSGRVKAMLDERGHKLDEAGPSTPVTILGLDGAPTAGDRFQVLDDEREARQVALKRQQLQREQSVRTKKTITLDEIGRRLALGDFKELNIVLKGDVDGSIEALADSLQKLSTEEIAVNIIHKAVGGITESDVLLATASNAIIVGFQVRPSASARKLAEKEDVDIRLYSIIYDAINEIKDAMEGMLSPEMKEEITCNIEVRETFKISKVGTIAGCMVMDGTITRNARIRLIRDGVVVYTGELGSLKRFKDDVKEVSRGTECGLNIKNFNDIKVGDIIEGFKEVEVKKTLD